MDRIDSLLKSLKDLYTRVQQTIVSNRIKSYNPIKSHQQDKLSETLHTLIDEIVNDVAQHHTEPQHQHNQLHEMTSLPLKHNKKQGSPEPDDDEKEATHVDSLASYFRDSKTLESQPSMAARLRRTSWEHVHAAHRLARNADVKGARFQIELAVDALKALADYMPADEYQQFVSSIQQQLQSEEAELEHHA